MSALWATDALSGHAIGLLAGPLRLLARPGVALPLPCHYECRPLLDLLGVEPGRICGALARLLALLATVAPYPLAARLAWLLLGVKVSRAAKG